jgi:hypothetical protein
MSNRNRAPSPTTEEKRILDSKDKLSKMSKEYNEIGDQLKSLLEKKGNTILAKEPKLDNKVSVLSGRKDMIQSKLEQAENSFNAAEMRADQLRDDLIAQASKEYNRLVAFAEDQHKRMMDKARRELATKKESMEIKDRSVNIELSNIEKMKEIVSPALQKQLYDSWSRMKTLRDIMSLQCSQQNLKYPIPDLPERPCDPPPIPAIPQMISPDIADFFSTLGNENAISAEERRKAQDEERRIREAADKEYEERMMKIAMDAKKRDQEELERRRAINKRRAEEIQEPAPATEEIGVAVNLYRRKREVIIGDD